MRIIGPGEFEVQSTADCAEVAGTAPCTVPNIFCADVPLEGKGKSMRFCVAGFADRVVECQGDGWRGAWIIVRVDARLLITMGNGGRGKPSSGASISRFSLVSCAFPACGPRAMRAWLDFCILDNVSKSVMV